MTGNLIVPVPEATVKKYLTVRPEGPRKAQATRQPGGRDGT
jgi:hypothetical protein